MEIHTYVNVEVSVEMTRTELFVRAQPMREQSWENSNFFSLCYFTINSLKIDDDFPCFFWRSTSAYNFQLPAYIMTLWRQTSGCAVDWADQPALSYPVSHYRTKPVLPHLRRAPYPPATAPTTAASNTNTMLWLDCVVSPMLSRYCCCSILHTKAYNTKSMLLRSTSYQVLINITSKYFEVILAK